MQRILLLIIPVLVFSCSVEKPAGTGRQTTSQAATGTGIQANAQTSPVVVKDSFSLEITPADATRNSTLSLIAKGINLPDAKIEWLINGNPLITPVPHQLKARDLKLDDTVQAKATIKENTVLSKEIKIKNTPPELTKVKIMPEIFKPGHTLYIEASASDVDGDSVTILYEWSKNGESAGSENKITVPLKRGDRISVKITPFDGEIYGGSITLNREIGNLPPMIIDNKDVSFEQDVFTYQVKATDPDGDSLAYSLKTAPSGMSIDAKGLIRWKVPLDFKGKASVAASVTDGHGGEATQNFVLEIKTEK